MYIYVESNGIVFGFYCDETRTDPLDTMLCHVYCKDRLIVTLRANFDVNRHDLVNIDTFTRLTDD